MKRNSLLIYKSSHIETSESDTAFYRNGTHCIKSVLFFFLLGDVIMVDVILLPEELLNFFICIYLFILVTHSSYNFNVPLVKR